MTIQSLGIVFPGQGSQSVGMLSDIAREFPEVENIFREASNALGYDLWKLVQEGPATDLDKTEITQPALLTSSYALWRILTKNKTIHPTVMAGHSLGEYSALVCANAFSFADGIKLVAARGKFMQEAVPAGVGGLGAIIGLDEATICSICEKAAGKDEILSPANFNSPGQIVVAGHTIAVERALVMAKEAGAKLVKLLPVSVSSHCMLMKPAAEKLALMLDSINIKTPEIKVIGNADVKVYDTAASIRAGLIKQLYMPVRWVETIEMFAKMGVTHITECGPGKILTGLNKRIISDIQLASTADAAGLHTLLEAS